MSIVKTDNEHHFDAANIQLSAARQLRSRARAVEPPYDDSENDKRYWLESFVHACTTEAGTILLDTKRNLYHSIGMSETRTAAMLVNDWPRLAEPDTDAETSSASPHDTSVIDELVATGLLTSHAPPRARIWPAAARYETVSSVGLELDVEVVVHNHHMLKFLRAIAWTAWMLRTQSLYSIVDSVGRRHQHGDGNPDRARLIELTCVFRRLRPFAFSAKDRCLFHALALVRFLSMYQLYPAWVVGVQTNPWVAHSWVQQDELILDCDPHQVFEFTPILII